MISTECYTFKELDDNNGRQTSRSVGTDWLSISIFIPAKLLQFPYHTNTFFPLIIGFPYELSAHPHPSLHWGNLLYPLPSSPSKLQAYLVHTSPLSTSTWAPMLFLAPHVISITLEFVTSITTHLSQHKYAVSRTLTNVFICHQWDTGHHELVCNCLPSHRYHP